MIPMWQVATEIRLKIGFDAATNKRRQIFFGMTCGISMMILLSMENRGMKVWSKVERVRLHSDGFTQAGPVRITCRICGRYQ